MNNDTFARLTGKATEPSQKITKILSCPATLNRDMAQRTFAGSLSPLSNKQPHVIVEST